MLIGLLMVVTLVLLKKPEPEWVELAEIAEVMGGVEDAMNGKVMRSIRPLRGML